jgi:hypothetical protein
MEKVKSILFKVQLKGRGVVNYDSNDQRFIWNKNTAGNGQEKCDHDNVSFAKKRWYKNDDGSFEKKLIISSNCLRHYLFENDTMFQSPNVLNNEALLYTMIANPGVITRGYMFADKECTIKRTSVLGITDAEQTNNAVSTIETFTRSGEKTVDENKSDITFFKKETIGEIEYEAIGNIDLMQLKFVSCDQLFDRMAFNPDFFGIYSKILGSKIKNFNSELGYYQIKNSTIELPEYGFVFSKENIIDMVKETLTNILKLKITKSGAYADVVSVQYKFVIDPLKDRFNNENGWSELNLDVINDLDFVTEDFYVEYDSEKAKALRAELEEVVKRKKADNKAKADDKKQKAKEFKESKNKKSEEEVVENN